QPRESAAFEQSGPGERARRLLDEALLAAKELELRGVAPAEEIVARFRAAADASPRAAAAWFDLAVVLEKAGKVADAAEAYRAAAQANQGPKELRFAAADRAAQIALM